MTSNELRSKFIEFFKERGHKVIPSSSLVPENDPSVLFTTAGMQQFKRFYLFPEEAPAAKITTIQKCLRTGDIDEVGDESHLTFFEMLGNFSFGYETRTDADQTRTDADGSYFKEEAILYAWEFLTEVLNIDKSRIHASYFLGEKTVPEDLVSKEILQKLDGLVKVTPQGFDDNFWSLGTEGSPGGPTVEFYVDGIEVWNLVFNQFVIKNGEYIESELKGVDTGMGLERLTAVMQGKSDVYETDLFMPLIQKLEEVSDKKYSEKKELFRIIVDHLRSADALIFDGVLPSNKDQGYVLRRLIRRAVVKGKQLGIEENLIANFVSVCHPQVVGDPLIVDSRLRGNDIGNVLEQEELKFRNNIEDGLRIIESQDEFSGKVLFDLYQTYGIPVEVTIEEAEKLGQEVGVDDKEEFYALLKKHQDLSRTASAGMFKGGLADNKVETTRLHTAAHLLLAALRQVLSSEVSQKGSNITEERLRFDFNWPEKLSSDQIEQVENIVNEKIKEDIPVEMEELSLEDAKKSGATGVFDDRYGEKVKVYTIGPSTPDGRSGSREFFSREICGGPHMTSTGELGAFKITKEESSSAGIRRIKATLK